MVRFARTACTGDPLSCALFRSRVLLAEDDLFVALTFAEILDDAGCSVTLAADGAEALEKVEAGLAFDLLVTDLLMPRLDGAGLIRAVRRRGPWRPVLVLTGAPPRGGAGVLQIPGEGPLILVEKPVTAERLLTAAARAVCRKADGKSRRWCPALPWAPARRAAARRRAAEGGRSAKLTE